MKCSYYKNTNQYLITFVFNKITISKIKINLLLIFNLKLNNLFDYFLCIQLYIIDFIIIHSYSF